MALSTTEKKIAVTVAVDASKAKKGFDEYKAAADGAKKSTDDLAKQEAALRKEIDQRSKHMAAAARQTTRLQAEQAAAAKAAGDAFKKGVDDQLRFVGRFTAGVGLAAIAIDKLSQRQLDHANLLRNQKISIEAAREATRGLVSDMDLLRMANTATAFGIANTEEEFAEMTVAAQKLGARLGTDAKKAAEDYALAVARGSPKILDNLGIMIKQSEANEIYAKALGKSVKALTETERAEAFQFAVKKRTKEVVADLTVETENASATVQRWKVRLENATDTSLDFGAAVGTTLIEDLDSFANKLSFGTVGTSAYEKELTKATKAQEDWARILNDFVHVQDRVIEQQRAQNQAMAEGAALAVKLSSGLAGVNIEAAKLRQAASFRALVDLSAEKELRLLDEQIAAAKTVAGNKQKISDLESDRNDLLIEQAALVGDVQRVEQLQHDERMRQMREHEVSQKASKEKKDQFAAERKAFLEARNQARIDEATLSRDELRRLGNPDLIDPSAQIAEIQNTERAKADIVLNERLRAIENQRAAGVEPLAMIRAEEQARIDHLEFLRTQTSDKAELLRIEDQIQAEHHRATLARIAEEKRAREQAWRTTVQISDASGQIARQSMSLGAEVTDSVVKNEKQREAARRAFGAADATIIGITESVKAAAAFASFNFVQGSLHTAASALAITKAALLGGGVIGGGGGGAGPSGGSASFRPSDRKRREPRDIDGKPISREGEKHAPPTSGGGKNSPNLTVHFHSVLPPDEEKAGLKLKQLWKLSDESMGDV